MSAYKYSMIFQYLSGNPADPTNLNLKGGWSESVYRTTYSTALLTAFRGLAQQRAVLLPSRSYVSGLRVQRVDPSGPGSVTTVNLPGGSLSADADIPQMALLVRLTGLSVTNVRSYRIAAIPDSQVSFGEYKPNSLFIAGMNAYLMGLNNWNFRGSDLTQVKVPLVSIDSAGNYVTNATFSPAANSQVKVLRTVDAFGNSKGGIYSVKSVTSTTQGQISGWQWGACTGGNIVIYLVVYPQINVDSTDISRVVTRKVGRPSLGYRGRRSKRRR